MLLTEIVRIYLVGQCLISMSGLAWHAIAVVRFRVRSGRKLKIAQPPIITVIGKAFFDIGHAPGDHANRRTDLAGYAAWEIHPVMKLTAQ